MIKKKKIITALLSLLVLLQPLLALGVEIPGYEGGINNENTYKEVIFVTGQPIELEGTLKISIKEGKGKQTESYSFKLENKALDVQLSRSIKLSTLFEVNDKQTTSKKSLDSYKETIKIGKTKYEVKTEDYQWNQSQVVQDTGLLEFYAGDWSARKRYKIDKGDEQVTVATIGNLVGYDSPWSATETQTLEYIIEYTNKLTGADSWQATAKVETSYNKTKDYNYVENVPSQISFKGGYILTEKHENLLKYSYDLPVIIEGETFPWRNIGQASTQIDTNPIITRLNIPALKDTRGLPSEKDILLIASMDGLALNSTKLGPSTPMSRGDFAKALVGSMDIEIQEETTSRGSGFTRGRQPEVEETFIDVPESHRNFKYIEAISERDIMQGISKGRFAPDKSITNAEVITILLRTIGLQNLAPIQKYTTGYKDDRSIPTWAKDHVYMAKELGIISQSEYFYPNRPISKEETAVTLVNFINYLQTKLLYDYRENILNN